MKNSLIFTLVMLLLFSCAEKLIEKPDNLIPSDKMVLILKELAIVNAAKATNLSKLKENGIDPTMFVFEKYKIDSAQFVDSDRYYASIPSEYEAIYKEVENQLVTMGEKMQEQKKISDSLNLLKKSLKKDANSKLNDTLKIKNAPQ